MMDLFEYAKSAVEEMSNKLKKNSQNTTDNVSQIVPAAPFKTAGYWLVDWNHPDAKYFRRLT